MLIAEDDEHGAVGYALGLVPRARRLARDGGAVRRAALAGGGARAGAGRGSATRLLHEVYREVRAAGVEEMMIGVLATNEPAMRLYAREGFTPWVVLTFGKVPEVD